MLIGCWPFKSHKPRKFLLPKLKHAFDYNVIAKELIRLAKKFTYRYIHH